MKDKLRRRPFLLGLIVLVIIAIGAFGLVIFVFDKPPGPRPGPDNRQSTPSASKPKVEKTYTKKITNEKPIILKGNDVLKIIDTHYIQKNKIVLKDNAQLIIRDSFLELEQEYNLQYNLEATGKSKVEVEDSKIKSSPFFNWTFLEDSQFKAKNLDDDESLVWHLFAGRTRVVVDGARFNGTVSDSANVDISNSKDMEIELDFPVGTRIDTALPTKISSLSIPKKGNSSLKYSLNIKNSTADGWGIGMFPQSDITIRDVEKSLVVTFIAAPPWYERTVTFDDLKAKHYRDKTWNIGENTKLRLVNVKTNKWSPFATQRNTLVIRNSELADMVNFSGFAKNIIENSTVTLVRAQENVQITLKNSTVEGDVIAKDNGVVTLINTKVGGEIVEEDNGKVIKK